MVSRVATVAFKGIEAVPVDVQVHMASGMVAFSIVGLGDKAVAESKERVRAALSAIGLAMPAKRITVNLAPADLPKEGSHFDLPIAIALMAAMGLLPADFISRYVVLGELSLDGSVEPVSGALPAAMAANGRDLGLICPKACGPEAAWASDDMDILAVNSLVQVLNHMKGTQVLTRPKPGMAETGRDLADFRDVKGQETAKRALEVAAAGGHHMLMVGPPGAGKSMLASRLPSILPPMDASEMLEVSTIASVAGELRSRGVSTLRPYRNPHHSASQASLIGGGHRALPGEMVLAHNGILFLDELPEFQPRALEALRQPMESGEAVVARANHHITYPARFQLIAAMNPCKCGMAGEPGHVCKRGAKCATDYQARISGPLLDRIDIQIELAAVRASDLTLPPPAEGSADIAARVAGARAIQTARFGKLGLSTLRTNAHLDGTLLEEVARPDAEGLALLQDAANAMNLSARGYHRVLRLARTLADLDGHETVTRLNVAEALSYRQKLASFQLAA
ncbi:MAG: YifB family Mg chelatase-like AAA ATPase [Anderseniella sp.]